ncbi:Methoxyneurosporene dehydrogenase [Rhodovulum sp. PH10]|uniref:1-hydroxycarotenoid 3,4-desaturase CrtD n=1 Tax=Rhodovulum sp. PH10 TaxID=1187851 RepID=UPI00027C21A3|nr:1-hydroxycarotenoid 3,4-desaturase CrtD [Rhodovulum sp. PH10]EJW12818.1 Methoxyneurosporene dehydrogenase [Rhodovulum sp. PH10]
MANTAIVVGAGIGGLAAAVDLAVAGVAVTVVEAAATPGGKIRRVPVAGTSIDAGPTVLTMRWVFEDLLAAAGTSVARELSLQPLELIARHAWSATERLDLFADLDRSADAVGDFAGAAEARGFREFCARAARIYRVLEKPYLCGSRLRTPFGLVKRVGFHRLSDLIALSPYATLWSALGRHFRDPRLQQLFGRYATYVGSSPFQTPATLMLVAHVEGEGVWVIEGGMHRLATALATVATRLGVTFRYGTPVREVLVDRTMGATGVVLDGGERLAADNVVLNTDVGAVASGLLGEDVSHAAPKIPPAIRSLSALTWTVAAQTDGFPLHHHTVFFSRDYRAEFDRLFGERRFPHEPTVYVCAQDRGADPSVTPQGPERLLCLVNAPAIGDRPIDPAAIEACENAALEKLAACGLTIRYRPEASRLTTPADFHRLFPGTGGALYGRASHGWTASFRRPGSRTRIPGLYLAGGSTHPGPGLPMAALSGRLAAAALISDRASTRRSHPAGICGGTSTR